MVSRTAARPRVPEPQLNVVRHMSETGGRWERRGDYAIWCGTRSKSEPRYVLYEKTDRGILEIPCLTTAPVLHRIIAGTPHHVAHLFGFWHVADCDTVWIQSARDGDLYYSLMLGGVSDKPARNDCLWLCRRCGSTLASHSYATAELSFAGFLPFALEKVRAFNEDSNARSCGHCGEVHPVSYGFYEESDTEAERAARLAG